MRTEPSNGIAGRFPNWVARCRQWLAGLGPAGRLLLLLGGIGALVALAYGVPGTVASAPSLYGGQRFTPRQAAEIVRALAEAGIRSHPVDGRIEVNEEQLANAHTAVQKAGLAPRSLKALVDDRPAPGLFSTAAEAERVQTRHRERLVEQAIQELDPSLSAVVQIYRERPSGLSRKAPTRATVWLEVDGTRTLRPQIVERISHTVQAWIPDLGPDGLMLLDSAGHPYVVAGNPSLTERSHQRAREEEIQDELLDQLDWITGVRVAVSIGHEPAIMRVQAALLEEDEPIEPPKEPLIAVNEPLDPIEVVETGATPPEEPPHRPEAPAPIGQAGRVTVLVRVPNTYYSQLASNLTATTHKSPSLDELQGLVRETESTIRRSIESVLPASERGEIFIERIYVPTPAVNSASLADTGKSGRLPWLPTTAVVGVTCLVVLPILILATGRSRQTARQSSRSGGGRTRRVDGPDLPLPSEQVRGLVRLDPAAAASLLQRWIGEPDAGGSTS